MEESLTSEYESSFDVINPPVDDSLFEIVTGVPSDNNRELDEALSMIGLHRRGVETSPIGEQLHTPKVSRDQMHDYLQAIRHYELLDAEQVVDLAIKIEVGLLAGERKQQQESQLTGQELRELSYLEKQGQQAHDTLIYANTQLVIKLAKRYTGLGLPLLDLVQEGNRGLMHAVEMFDYTKGFKFSTYSTWWIRHSIQYAVNNQARLIRLPEDIAKLLVSARRIQSQASQKFGHPLTNEELAKKLKITVERLEKYIAYDHQRPVSLNTPVGEGDGSELGEFIFDEYLEQPDKIVEQTYLIDDVRKLVDTLPVRAATVIRLCFGIGDNAEPLNYSEAGRRLGVTHPTVKAIQIRAIAMLQDEAISRGLSDYIIQSNGEH